MLDVEKKLNGLHQQAIKLTAEASLSDRKELKEKVHKLARRLNQLVISDRAMALALLAVYSNDYQPSAQWMIKLGTLTGLLAHELGYLEEISETLVRAAITMDLSVLDVINARFSSRPLSSEMKKRWPQHTKLSVERLLNAGITDKLWLTHVEQHHERPNGKGFPNRLTASEILPTSMLLSLANDAMELLMPTAKRHGIEPTKVISRLYFRQGYYLHAHIKALTSLFQPEPIGAQVKLTRGGIALLLRKPGKDYVWGVQSVTSKGHTRSEVIKLEKPDVERVFPMLRLEKPDLMSTWLEGHSQMSNKQKHDWLSPIPEPSPLKVKLNKLLSDTQPSIKRVSEYVANEPMLAELIIEMANRKVARAKPTKDVKHAVMLLGLDRLGPTLIRGDLINQCKLRRFPLDFLVYQHIEIFTECAAQLALQTYFMMPENARTLATFASCGWLFDQRLQQQTSLKDALDGPTDITSLFALLSTAPRQELAMHGVAMANKWQISLREVATLEVFAGLKEPQELPMKTRHPYYLLELASHLTIELMGRNSLQQERQALMTRLDIDEERMMQAKEAVMACQCVYTPLFG